MSRTAALSADLMLPSLWLIFCLFYTTSYIALNDSYPAAFEFGVFFAVCFSLGIVYQVYYWVSLAVGIRRADQEDRRAIVD